MLIHDEELENVLIEIGGKDNNTNIQRYKGLGEMDANQFGIQQWILKKEYY